MSLFEHRAARNEAMFREINEESYDLSDVRPGAHRFICECANAECSDLVELTVAEYEEVRANGRWFFVAPGHEDTALEKVVSRHANYFVVEKIAPDSAALADRTDPRQ